MSADGDAGAAGNGELEVGAECADGTADFAIDADHVAVEGADSGVKEEEMGSALAVGREAVQASAEEQGFLVEEAVGPEDVVGDVEFECAEHGVGGRGDDEFGLAAEFLIPGFGHGVLAGGTVVDAAVAGGAGLAGGGSGAGGFLGVGAVGGEFSFRDVDQRHCGYKPPRTL